MTIKTFLYTRVHVQRKFRVPQFYRLTSGLSKGPGFSEPARPGPGVRVSGTRVKSFRAGSHGPFPSAVRHWVPRTNDQKFQMKIHRCKKYYKLEAIADKSSVAYRRLRNMSYFKIFNVILEYSMNLRNFKLLMAYKISLLLK